MDGRFSPFLAQLLMDGLTRRALLITAARSDLDCGRSRLEAGAFAYAQSAVEPGLGMTQAPDSRDAVIVRLVNRAAGGMGSASCARIRVEAL